jgi:hypothetical protein
MPVPRLASATATQGNETLALIQFRRSHPLHATTRCTRRRRQIWMPRPRYHISPSDLAEWARASSQVNVAGMASMSVTTVVEGLRRQW